MYCYVLYYTVLWCTVLHCTVLYCTVQYGDAYDTDMDLDVLTPDDALAAFPLSYPSI